jgi:hypothetical protein
MKTPATSWVAAHKTNWFRAISAIIPDTKKLKNPHTVFEDAAVPYFKIRVCNSPFSCPESKRQYRAVQNTAA